MSATRWVSILALTTSLAHAYQNIYRLPSLRKVEFTILVSRQCSTLIHANARFQGDTLYAQDIYHFANSSTQQSACTVEPGTTRDVGIIVSLTIIFIRY